MIVIKHNVNSINELASLEDSFGLHVEVRSYKDRIIVGRDPFIDNSLLEDYLKVFKHKLIVLDIKTEGIENKVIELAEKYCSNKYFLVNLMPSAMKKIIGRDFKKIAVRFSDMESIETCKFWEGKAEWVWVDIFRDFPLDEQKAESLKKNFKLCTISPEIIGLRAAVERYRGRMNVMKIDAVCTDLPELWK